MKHWSWLIFILLLLAGCGGSAHQQGKEQMQAQGKPTEASKSQEWQIEQRQEKAEEQPADDNEGTEKDQLPRTEKPAVETVSKLQQEEAAQEEKLHAYMDQMTAEEKVGQLFMAAVRKDADGNRVLSADGQFKQVIDKYHVGGVILFSENIEDSIQVKKLIGDLQSESGVPLFIGVDEEGGVVSRVGSNKKINAVPFKEAFVIGQTKDADNAYREAQRMGKLLKELGFNMDFAPDADIYNEPSNTVIGRRSFGTDSQTVTPMVLAFMKGLKEQGILPVIKHFPGHGNTKEDSHSKMAYVEKNMAALEKEELTPFITGVEQGADGLMKGHLLVPKVDADYPASLSAKWEAYLEERVDVSKTLLITDAMDMGAIVQRYSSSEAALLSIEAGNDIILMPQDLDAAYKGVLAAVEKGRISEERLDRSVEKILSKKIAQKLLVLS